MGTPRPTGASRTAFSGCSSANASATERARLAADRADHRSPITRTASKPPPRWLLHSLGNSVIERWNSSAGVCTGRVTQWSILPRVTASKMDRTDSQSPQRTAATRSAVGVDGADRGKHLDAIRVLRTDRADDQRNRLTSRQQVPHPGFQLRGPAADDDLIVRAIPLGQLPIEDLPGARLTADDDDSRLRPGSFTAHGGGWLLRRSGGNA